LGKCNFVSCKTRVFQAEMSPSHSFVDIYANALIDLGEIWLQ